MIKRPLNPRFGIAVRDRRKTTTIRATAWPLGKPIMLYHWRGAPYRSKQQDVAAIVVARTSPIHITHGADGHMRYDCPELPTRPLYETEGFATASDMDDWFRLVVPRGKTVCRHLMHFGLAP